MDSKKLIGNLAAVIAVIIGMDVFTWKKLIAAALVITGVIIVNGSKAAAQDK